MGWDPPEISHIPTGDELASDYLEPLASCPPIKDRLKLRSRVRSVTKLHVDRSAQHERRSLPFELTVETPGKGKTQTFLARAIIDASGVLDTPRPMGVNGLPIDGEASCNGRITYGIPPLGDLATIGARVLVLGSGHSAMQSVVALSMSERQRQIVWALRRDKTCGFLCSASSDRFPARLVLQSEARRRIDSGHVRMLFGAIFTRVSKTTSGIVVTSIDGTREEFDHIVVATGYRPDFAMVRELQTDFDPVYECSAGMRPVLDTAAGCCGAVPPHGEAELRHPETGFYVVGVRSFGRASSFLMLAGYEQVRTIAASLAGDTDGVLPRPAKDMGQTTLEDFLKHHSYYRDLAVG
jgi:cation diffusion facilitator CzcD-associated flavoprotein CzcO